MVYVLLINMTSFSGASCVLFSFVTVIFIAPSPPSLGFLHNDFSNLELQIQQGFVIFELCKNYLDNIAEMYANLCYLCRLVVIIMCELCKFM